MAQTIADLLGEDLENYPLGEDRAGDDLTAGYIPGHGIEYQPLTVLGDPVAGLSVSGPAPRLDDAEVARLGPLVAAAAAEITRLVGGVSLPRAGAT